MNKPNPIRQIMKMADRQNIINMGLDPNNVISFGGGWVNHEAPREMRETYVKLSRNRNKFHASGAYSTTQGDPECRRQLASMERELFGMKGLSGENIIIGMGSTQITHDMFVTLADPGDTIMLLDPTYANYPGQVEFALPGSKMVRLKVMDEENWQYLPDVKRTIEDFHDLFHRHRPKIVMVPAPDNPTSMIPDEHLVKEMLDTTADAGSYLVMDFAYKTLYFGDAPPSYFSWSPSEHPNLVCLHSNSKWARGLGRRFGWMEASPAVIRGMERTQQASILCPDTLHQMAIGSYLKAALKDGSLGDYVEKTRRAYEETARFTIKSIDRHLGLRRLIPQGGLYTVVDVEQDADEFVPRILKKTGVLFIPGGGFGPSLKNGMRISYGPHVGKHRTIEKGMERVGVMLDRELA